MKKLFFILSVGFLLAAFTVPADLGSVLGGLRSGNAAEIAKSFDASVDLTLPGKTGTYARAQGQQVLADFFASNPSKGFTIVHQGDHGGNEYCIGTLATRNGNYRTTIYMKNKGGAQVVQEIRLEAN